MTLQRPRGLAARRELRFLAAGFASAALLVGTMAPAIAAAPVRASAAATVQGVRTAQVQIRKVSSSAKFAPVGTVKVGALTANEQEKSKPRKGAQPKKGYYGANKSAFLAIPTVSSLPVVASSPVSGRSGAVGSDGISGTEMRYASPDGYRWNYSIEPPDMALCVGGGFVVEGVNGAVQIFNSSGAALTGVTPANYFLYGPNSSEFYHNGLPNYNVPSVGDPSCVYDPQTQRFFMTWYTYPNSIGNFGTVLAVSNSSNPALDNWSIFELPDAGDTTLPGCLVACFPDYPHIGLDANALWLTNNEFDFGQNPSPYAGATIWGISKRLIIDSGTIPWAMVWGLGFDGYGEPLAFTVMPAVTPNGGYDTGSFGTQYFMSTRDMYGTRDNVLDVWAMTGTNSLNLTGGAFPTLSRVQLTGQTYACECVSGAPVGGARQMSGPHPLGTNGFPPYFGPNQPLNRLDTNDDRMHQVVYSGGMLWGAAATVMNVAGNTNGPTVGVAWWTVRVVSFPGSFNASFAGQGYIGVKNSYLWFPAVGVTNSVRGIVAMSFSGPDRYPSVAYAQFDPFMGASSVRIAAAGTAPADGFTGYPYFTRNGTERWGDYNAAATDEAGNVWFAAEYIGKNSLNPNRAPLLNWGTWIGVTYPQ